MFGTTDYNSYEKNEMVYNNLMFYPVSETLPQFKTRMIQAHNEHLMAYNPTLAILEVSGSE